MTEGREIDFFIVQRAITPPHTAPHMAQAFGGKRQQRLEIGDYFDRRSAGTGERVRRMTKPAYA